MLNKKSLRLLALGVATVSCGWALAGNIEYASLNIPRSKYGTDPSLQKKRFYIGLGAGMYLFSIKSATRPSDSRTIFIENPVLPADLDELIITDTGTSNNFTPKIGKTLGIFPTLGIYLGSDKLSIELSGAWQKPRSFSLASSIIQTYTVDDGTSGDTTHTNTLFIDSEFETTIRSWNIGISARENIPLSKGFSLFFTEGATYVQSKFKNHINFSKFTSEYITEPATFYTSSLSGCWIKDSTGADAYTCKQTIHTLGAQVATGAAVNLSENWQVEIRYQINVPMFNASYRSYTYAVNNASEYEDKHLPITQLIAISLVRDF